VASEWLFVVGVWCFSMVLAWGGVWGVGGGGGGGGGGVNMAGA
jgi:hypothetical protein